MAALLAVRTPELPAVPEKWALADLVKFHRTENGHRLLIVHERPERLYACPSRNPDLILKGVH